MSNFATDLIGKHVKVCERQSSDSRSWVTLGVGIVRAVRLDDRLTVTIQVTSQDYFVWGDADYYGPGDLVTVCPEACEHATKLRIIRE